MSENEKTPPLRELNLTAIESHGQHIVDLMSELRELGRIYGHSEAIPHSDKQAWDSRYAQELAALYRELKPLEAAAEAALAQKADDPRALCPWCHKPIGEVDLRFDPTPVGTLLLTFRCKSCHVLIGHQVVPADWVLQQMPPRIVAPGPGHSFGKQPGSK